MTSWKYTVNILGTPISALTSTWPEREVCQHVNNWDFKWAAKPVIPRGRVTNWGSELTFSRRPTDATHPTMSNRPARSRGHQYATPRETGRRELPPRQTHLLWKTLHTCARGSLAKADFASPPVLQRSWGITEKGVRGGKRAEKEEEHNHRPKKRRHHIGGTWRVTGTEVQQPRMKWACGLTRR